MDYNSFYIFPFLSISLFFSPHSINFTRADGKEETKNRKESQQEKIHYTVYELFSFLYFYTFRIPYSAI